MSRSFFIFLETSDSDEVIHIDKEKLFSLPEGIKQVNMQLTEPIISAWEASYIAT